MSTLNPRGDRVNIKEFLPDIKADVPGIDSDLALQHIMDAVIQLARESKIMRKTICIRLEDCINSYLINPSPDLVYKLDRVNVSHDAGHCAHIDVDAIRNSVYLDIDANTVYIDPMPMGDVSGITIELTVVLVPDRTGDTVPKTIYNNWADAVSSLALSRIYKIAGAKWYSLQASRENFGWYTGILPEIRRNAVTRGRSVNIKLRPGKGLRGIR